jgi:predicted glycogen debranching enzyme
MEYDQALDKVLNEEFLVTNGIGGYSSSSISFANTRKYHGLLVAAANPPTQRNILVHKMEERVKVNDQYSDLSTNVFERVVHPHGYNYLKGFRRLPVATWTYEGDGWSLSKEVMMSKDSNTTVVVYKNLGETALDLELHPLFSFRDYHSILRKNYRYDFYYTSLDNGLKIHPYLDCPAIYCQYSKGEFTEARAWYQNFHYDREEYRGMDATEDSYRIGFVTQKLKPGGSAHILFTDDEKKLKTKPATVRKQTIANHDAKAKVAGDKDFLRDLLIAGDQFIVNRASTNSQTILAGYHWFTDWGRDTMISMRGLTISTGRKKESESILTTFFKYLDQGMLPNRFPDHGEEVEYNTIDATLWLFIVMFEYYQKFEDKKFVKKYIKELESIIKYHIKGTRYNIHVNEQGFLQGGEQGTQLTWMDAKVNDYVVTPRRGCPVEINVLWYNALKIFDELSRAVGYDTKIDTHGGYKKLEKNFKPAFLNKEGYLNDFIHPNGEANTDFRSNQIYAVSLPFSLLNKHEEKTLVDLVGQKLLTDYGLRTLDQENQEFVAVYKGNQWSRDTSYHQGTVWPFILGEYIEAYLKVNKYSKKAKKEVAKMLQPLQAHFYEHECLHGISEIFDGRDPRQGRGCIQQAWSVAAIIKVCMDHPDIALS